MPECAKTHLQQSRISKFSGEDPFKGRGGKGKGKEGEEREGKAKGRREGKDREGRRGTGRDRGGKGREGRNGGWWGGEGRGGALDMGSASPPRDKLWIRPLSCCLKAVCSSILNWPFW